MHPEYSRRNLVQAKSIGARSNIRVAAERLTQYRQSPKWLRTLLWETLEKLEPVPHELAQWRDAAPDAPHNGGTLT